MRAPGIAFKGEMAVSLDLAVDCKDKGTSLVKGLNLSEDAVCPAEVSETLLGQVRVALTKHLNDAGYQVVPGASTKLKSDLHFVRERRVKPANYLIRRAGEAPKPPSPSDQEMQGKCAGTCKPGQACRLFFPDARVTLAGTLSGPPLSSGRAQSVSWEGDWFVIEDDGTNFRWVCTGNRGQRADYEIADDERESARPFLELASFPWSVADPKITASLDRLAFKLLRPHPVEVEMPLFKVGDVAENAAGLEAVKAKDWTKALDRFSAALA